MTKIESGNGNSSETRDIADVRDAARSAEARMRPLQEIEMGWVAGGDGVPVWPY